MSPLLRMGGVLVLFGCALSGCKEEQPEYSGDNRKLETRTVMGFKPGEMVRVAVTVTGNQTAGQQTRNWEMSNTFQLRVGAGVDGVRMHQQGLQQWRGRLAPANFGSIYAVHLIPTLTLDADGLVAQVSGDLSTLIEALNKVAPRIEGGSNLAAEQSSDPVLRAMAEAFWNTTAIAHRGAMGKGTPGRTKVTMTDGRLGPMIFTIELHVGEPVPCFSLDPKPNCVTVTLTIAPDKVMVATAFEKARDLIPPGHQISGYTVKNRWVGRVRTTDERLLEMTLTSEGTTVATGPGGSDPVTVHERENRRYQFQ
ncbi:MAG: hypothetical protein SGI86_11145 [Deltaproteobacteria bacterium]|nr:hypothetical protein [Deltaproteobacteria bacterium]